MMTVEKRMERIATALRALIGPGGLSGGPGRQDDGEGHGRASPPPEGRPGPPERQEAAE